MGMQDVSVPDAILSTPSFSGTSQASAAIGSTATLAPTKTIATGLSWIDRATLAAIGIVVVVVTLPVLRGFGLRENERDAMRMLRVLSAEPDARNGARSDRTGQASLAELAATDRNLQRRLEDLEVLPDGALRRHGYLFDVSTLETGEPMLRAWPWEHAQTGRGAFVWTPRSGLLGHRNRDGRFSGAAGAPAAEEVLASGEWVVMSRR